MANQSKYLIIIAGPTASGKTGLAIKVAQHFDCPILSCDSRQFYREMSIGTAKPTAEERAKVEHFFVDNLSIHDAYSVGDYEREALEKLNEIYLTKDVAVMVGGSGLFIKAVCEGLNEFPEVPSEVAEQVEQDLLEKGLPFLVEELKEKDPESYKEIALENARRVQRAINVIRASGQPFSYFKNKPKAVRPFTPIYFCTEMDRAKLYERINLRVELMMQAGQLAEAQALHPHKSLKSLQTVGYKELFDHIDGEINLARAVELIQQNSRRYAKRQMTWFRKQAQNATWNYVNPLEVEAVLKIIDESVSN